MRHINNYFKQKSNYDSEKAQSIISYALILLFLLIVWEMTFAHTMVGGKYYLSILESFSRIANSLGVE